LKAVKLAEGILPEAIIHSWQADDKKNRKGERQEQGGEMGRKNRKRRQRKRIVA